MDLVVVRIIMVVPFKSLLTKSNFWRVCTRDNSRIEAEQQSGECRSRCRDYNTIITRFSDRGILRYFMHLYTLFLRFLVDETGVTLKTIPLNRGD